MGTQLRLYGPLVNKTTIRGSTSPSSNGTLHTVGHLTHLGSLTRENSQPQPRSFFYRIETEVVLFEFLSQFVAFSKLCKELTVCREPEALPFCALAYALIGIISTILVSLPFVRSALFALAG